jgi:hypothetical protein
MIIGAHSIIYSKNPDADRTLLRDVLKLPHVDVGDGWLIFGLPPSEVAVHPSPENDIHEFYLMCADVNAFISAMRTHNVECGPVSDQDWGLLTQVRLPGGGMLGVYQPRHARPNTSKTGSARPRRKTARKTTANTARNKTRAKGRASQNKRTRAPTKRS